MLEALLDIVGGWMPTTRRGWGCLLAIVVSLLIVAGMVRLVIALVFAASG